MNGWDAFHYGKTTGCPCVQDCEGRSLDCRKSCQAFIEYEKNRLDGKKFGGSYDKLDWRDKHFTASSPMTAGKMQSIRSAVRLRSRKREGYNI